MNFARDILAWYDRGHRILPWRQTLDPYAIWVSEIMLQQTRVETVLGYYQRFLGELPDIAALARVPEERLLKLWEGLGYYSRARNLQRAAREILERHGGEMPADLAALQKLSGIGPYTAGAIASIAFGIPAPAVDGNVQRVVSRVRGIREEAAGLMDPTRPGDFNNAMMELGATVCLPGAPRCGECPVSAHCDALGEGDARELPIKQKGRGQRLEKQGLVLAFAGNRVWVERRHQRLLQGLWVFPMLMDGQNERRLAAMLRERGAAPGRGKRVGEAKHVFTHIIWEMRIYQFEVREPVDIPEGQWVDLAALRALPMPTAVRAARELAIRELEQREGEGPA